MGEVIAFPSRVLAAPVDRPDDGPSAGRHESPARQRLTPRTDRLTPMTDVAAKPAQFEPSRRAREPLWREVAGAVLREERLRQRRTLAQIADRAGMSVQYLSELERGRKEASSEMLAAACGSLGIGLGEFARRCAGAFTSVSARPTGPLLMAA